MSESLDTIYDLGTVVGGAAIPHGEVSSCLQDVAKGAAAGTFSGPEGTATTAIAAGVESSACRDLVSRIASNVASAFWRSPGGTTPMEMARFGPIFGKPVH